MELTPIPRLTDGVMQLRPLTQADAAAHLAGEDEEMAKLSCLSWKWKTRSFVKIVERTYEKRAQATPRRKK
jgi:hypothetical protein